MAAHLDDLPYHGLEPLPPGGKLCECGCGAPAPIAKKTQRSRGQVKGRPVRFVRGHQGRGKPLSPEHRELPPLSRAFRIPIPPDLPIACDNREMRSVQNNGGATGGVTGRGFRPGRSGNPGGRPKGLAKATRELVGEDGMALAELWWSIAQDPMRRDSDRLEASKLLADRGWGKAAAFAEIEAADPLKLEDAYEAAEWFRAKILRLTDQREKDTSPSGLE
jgi:hypothetical protein